MRDSNKREVAAVRIEAAVRGRLTRKGTVVPTITPVPPSAVSMGNGGSQQDASVTTATYLGPTGGTRGEEEKVDENLACRQEKGEEGGGRGGAEIAPVKRSEIAAATAPATPAASVGPTASAAAVARIENLGVEGVRAFFDSLGLGACADRLRRRTAALPHEHDARERHHNGRGSDTGIDGLELARIMQAEDAGEELFAAGVSARLHRIKVMNALDIRNPSKGVTVPAHEGRQKIARAESEGALMVLRSRIAGEHVTASATVFLARRLLREQETMSGALRKLRCRVGNSDGCKANEIRADQGVAEPGELVQERTSICFSGCNRLQRDSGEIEPADKANAQKLRGRGENVGGGVQEATGSVPLSVLVELEEAVLGQMNLTGQVKKKSGA